MTSPSANSLLLFSYLVVSNSLQAHGQQRCQDPSGLLGQRFCWTGPGRGSLFLGLGVVSTSCCHNSSGVVGVAEPIARPVLAGILGTVPGSGARSVSPLTAPYKSTRA